MHPALVRPLFCIVVVAVVGVWRDYYGEFSSSFLACLVAADDVLGRFFSIPRGDNNKHRVPGLQRLRHCSIPRLLSTFEAAGVPGVDVR